MPTPDAWPQLSPDAITQSPDATTRNADTAHVHQVLADRNRWLDSAKLGLLSQWCDGPDSAAAMTGAASATPLYFSSFYIPPASTEDASITISALVEFGATADANLFYSIYYPVGSDWISPVTTGDLIVSVAGKTTNTTKWYDTTFTNPRPRQWLVVHVYAASMLADEKLHAVVITENARSDATVADGGGNPAAWAKLSTAAIGTADRPDSTHLLRWTQRAQNHVMARYPQTLGCHTFEPRTSAVATAQSYLYKVARGPNTGDCTLWVRAHLDGAGSGTIAAFVDTTDGTTAAGTDIATVGPAPFWFEISDVGGWTANSVHYVTITVTPPAGRTITVTDIVLVENEPPGTDFVYTSGGRNDAIPERYIPSDGDHEAAGSPIVASYRLGPDGARWTDRRTLVENAIFAAHRRTAVLISDRVGRNGATGDSSAGTNSTVNAFPASSTEADTLWRSKLTIPRGVDRVQVWIRKRRKGASVQTIATRYSLYVDGSLVSGDTLGGFGSTVTETGRLEETWEPLGEIVDVTDFESDVVEAEIRVGFIDRATGAPATGGPFADAIALDGVVVVPFKRDATPATVYFWGENTAGQALTGGAAATVTIEVPAERAFTLHHVRARVALTHSGAGTLALKLTSPTGTNASLRAAASTTTLDAWYGDDVIGDTTPAAALSGLEWETSEGTWTLTATDAGGTGAVGSITAFEIEIS